MTRDGSGGESQAVETNATPRKRKAAEDKNGTEGSAKKRGRPKKVVEVQESEESEDEIEVKVKHEMRDEDLESKVDA